MAIIVKPALLILSVSTGEQASEVHGLSRPRVLGTCIHSRGFFTGEERKAPAGEVALIPEKATADIRKAGLPASACVPSSHTRIKGSRPSKGSHQGRLSSAWTDNTPRVSRGMTGRHWPESRGMGMGTAPGPTGGGRVQRAGECPAAEALQGPVQVCLQL